MAFEALEAAASLLGFSVDSDCWAAADALLAAWEAWLEGRLAGMEEACRRLRGRRVCVTGSAATLPRDLRGAGDCEALVAADGSTAALLEEGLAPDIVVTDMDGPWPALWRAAEEGALPVVLVHGDNRHLLRGFLAGLEGRFVLTLQCLPPRLRALGLPVYASNGFSDGDRAALLALCCGARGIRLLGFDTGSRQLAGTKPWLSADAEPGPAKRVKLAVAEMLARVAAEAAGHA